MNLVADESVDGQIVSRLRADGYSVWYIAEESPSITDEEVLQIAADRSALLLTADETAGTARGTLLREATQGRRHRRLVGFICVLYTS